MTMDLDKLERGVALHHELKQIQSLQEKIRNCNQCWFAFATTKGQGQGIEIPGRLKRKIQAIISETISDIKAEIYQI